MTVLTDRLILIPEILKLKETDKPTGCDLVDISLPINDRTGLRLLDYFTGSIFNSWKH
jgi:hypothetical protein